MFSNVRESWAVTRKSWVDGDSFTFLNTKLKNNNYSTKIINDIFALRAYNLFLSFGLYIDPVPLKMQPFNIQPVSRIKLKQTKCREIFFYRCKRRQDWVTITERDVVFRQRAIFNDSFGESRGYSSFSCDLPDNFWGNPCLASFNIASEVEYAGVEESHFFSRII